ncbi:hypothetical protein EMIHUDRAFT_450554 [Emiliania huxleyi CCMP1516]|uniref:3-deoxy-7-phosphoheptulonate synthase n=2 Tax=Emiliania huxleyi TaxID=2903 RepID=A0A0D3JM97_EMIH1|nr:hypothetical protein EMIHUDRAFT_450554 [Emiliania huxleyi CCMP1516]EOD24632.1 hypothetical protein EMIHUDRAFT_450554 [Emiliania huxleyi CCMP1516]|eukprot:XP_005777061.1 hypothetical protein EMIHUDRAFT_450554 [Emiliania huxleyi CCMP1516]
MSSDLNVESIGALIPPSCVFEELPADLAVYEHVVAAREAVLSILAGHSDRFLLILQPRLGPSDQADGESAADAALRLAADAKAACDAHPQLQLLVLPTTTDATPSNEALRSLRRSLLALNRHGVAAAAAFADTITPQYVSDLLAYACVPASSAMCELVSGLSMPAGVEGSAAEPERVATALGLAAQSHHFLGVSSAGLCGIVESTGHPQAHAVLHSLPAGGNKLADAAARCSTALGEGGLSGGRRACTSACASACASACDSACASAWWEEVKGRIEEAAGGAVSAGLSGAEQARRRATAQTTDNLRIRSVRPLLPPAILTEELPQLAAHAALVLRSRQQLGEAIRGECGKLVALVGPPLLENDASVVEFAARLSAVAAEVGAAQWRVAAEPAAPGAAAHGWFCEQGLRRARRLLLSVGALGVPAAVEFGETVTPQYFADLLSWASVSAESRPLSNLVAGLSMPAGLRAAGAPLQREDGAPLSSEDDPSGRADFYGVTAHGIAGTVMKLLDTHSPSSSAREDMYSAASLAPYRQASHSHGIVHATGNRDCATLLPRSSLSAAAAIAAAADSRPVVVECGGAEVSPAAQAQYLREIAALVGEGKAPAVRGVSLSSHLLSGHQPARLGGERAACGGVTCEPLIHGLSVGEPCLDWLETAAAVRALADAVKKAAGVGGTKRQKHTR